MDNLPEQKVAEWLTPGGEWPEWGRNSEGLNSVVGDNEGKRERQALDIFRAGYVRNPKDGMVLFISGPLGSGKTTSANEIVKAVNGLYFPEPWQENSYLAEASQGFADIFWTWENGDHVPEARQREVWQAVMASQNFFGGAKENIIGEATAWIEGRPDRVAVVEPPRWQDGRYQKVLREMLKVSVGDELSQKYTKRHMRWQEDIQGDGSNAVLIYLSVDDGEVEKRMIGRGREFERMTPPQYRDMLGIEIERGVEQIANAGMPVAIVDGNGDFRNGGRVIEEVARMIESARG